MDSITALLYYFTSRFKHVFIWLYQPLRRIVKRITRGVWEGELTRLKGNIDERNSELELTRRQSREAQRSVEFLRGRVDALGGRVERAEYDNVVEENNSLKATLRMVEEDAVQRSANFERAMSRAATRQRNLESLLEARSKELQEAQAYMTKLDEVADSEVLRIVEPLNGQIFQAAAGLSDAPEFRFDDPINLDAAAVAEAKKRLASSSWVVSDFLHVLGDWNHAKHSLFVQSALQVGLAMYAREVANNWDPSTTKDTAVLVSVYEAIRKREPQSIAGRWRALGRAHLKNVLSSVDHADLLTSRLAGFVTDLLLVVGAAGSRDAIAEVVSAEFKNDLREIVTLALNFHSTAGERVVSRDFAVLAAKTGEPFDATRMTEEHPSDVDPQHAYILGTTQLGLVSERSVERQGRRGDCEIRRTVLLKCNVVLKDTSGPDQIVMANPGASAQ